MFKHTAVFAAAAVLALGAPGKPSSTAGSWQVDTHHSDARLISDATTDYGKTKLDFTLGFARVRGRMTLDDADPTKSSVDLNMYPATSMISNIDEDGKFLSYWLSNLSNHTLVCFHSKAIVRMPDGRLQAKGNLVITRVDRNVETASGEAYAGPVYGPPMIHRVVHDATFVFDAPAADRSSQKEGGIQLSGSTNMFREDFPRLVRAVVSTYWPALVQDKNCVPSAAGEGYHGSQCTGTFLEGPALPEAPHAANAEDIPGPSNFNAVVGNHLTILVHLRLTAKASGESAAGGN